MLSTTIYSIMYLNNYFLTFTPRILHHGAVSMAECHSYCTMIIKVYYTVCIQVEKTLEMKKNGVGMALQKVIKQGRNVYDVLAM